jgi:tetratricopeptide (TPR) repeat protein
LWIDRDPKLAYCRFDRGALYLTLGDYQKAINDLSEALLAKPNDPMALTKRGEAEEALGRISQALDDFRAALSSRPELQEAREGLDRIMAQQKRSDDEGRGAPSPNP